MAYDSYPDDMSDHPDYPGNQATGKDQDDPAAPPSGVRHYCAYNYRDYSDVRWFPPLDADRAPTPEDREEALQFAAQNSTFMFGTDLVFGGVDTWRSMYEQDAE